jgi:hypothetical protein
MIQSQTEMSLTGLSELFDDLDDELKEKTTKSTSNDINMETIEVVSMSPHCVSVLFFFPSFKIPTRCLDIRKQLDDTLLTYKEFRGSHISISNFLDQGGTHDTESDRNVSNWFIRAI